MNCQGFKWISPNNKEEIRKEEDTEKYFNNLSKITPLNISSSVIGATTESKITDKNIFSPSNNPWNKFMMKSGLGTNIENKLSTSERRKEKPIAVIAKLSASSGLKGLRRKTSEYSFSEILSPIQIASPKEAEFPIAVITFASKFNFVTD